MAIFATAINIKATTAQAATNSFEAAILTCETDNLAAIGGGDQAGFGAIGAKRARK
jgi:hypothetical protein